jgi:hypothetical protein
MISLTARTSTLSRGHIVSVPFSMYVLGMISTAHRASRIRWTALGSTALALALTGPGAIAQANPGDTRSGTPSPTWTAQATTTDDANRAYTVVADFDTDSTKAKVIVRRVSGRKIVASFASGGYIQDVAAAKRRVFLLRGDDVEVWQRIGKRYVHSRDIPLPTVPGSTGVIWDAVDLAANRDLILTGNNSDIVYSGGTPNWSGAALVSRRGQVLDLWKVPAESKYSKGLVLPVASDTIVRAHRARLALLSYDCAAGNCGGSPYVYSLNARAHKLKLRTSVQTETLGSPQYMGLVGPRKIATAALSVSGKDSSVQVSSVRRGGVTAKQDVKLRLGAEGVATDHSKRRPVLLVTEGTGLSSPVDARIVERFKARPSGQFRHWRGPWPANWISEPGTR